MVMIMKNNELANLINNFFTSYLKIERKYSDNTYLSYLNVINQFLNFLESQLNIKRYKITLNEFSKDNVLKFLMFIESTNKCTIKTRNHHLSVIKSFLQYVQSINPIYTEKYLEINSIKKKKEIKKSIDYLTIEELEIVLKQCNLNLKSGYKHFVILSLLYESACRVSELISIKISNINFSDNSYIKILGKGNKERIIYISKDSREILEKYINKFNITDGYLFLNHSNKKYTRFGINKMVEKYVNLGSKNIESLKNKNITPHSFRHSKAIHFLLNGTSLPIIQRFLGHNQIQTTEMYLDITSNAIIDAVNNAVTIINYKSDEECLWKGNHDLIELLESLKK